MSALLVAGSPAHAQSSAALEGVVVDSQHAAVAGAAVRLTHALSGFRRETATDGQGRFSFANVPFQALALRVERTGFRPVLRSIDLRSSLAAPLEIVLEISANLESVVVSASERLDLLDTEATGTRAQLSQRIIEKLPVAPGARGLEAVLLGFPGFAANANGAIHPRGAHNQMTYVIDGMPISDQFSGQFATSIDPGLVQSLELFTGNVPPEYGAKVSGVANITTKSGFDGDGRTFGQVEMAGGDSTRLRRRRKPGAQAEGSPGSGRSPPSRATASWTRPRSTTCTTAATPSAPRSGPTGDDPIGTCFASAQWPASRPFSWQTCGASTRMAGPAPHARRFLVRAGLRARALAIRHLRLDHFVPRYLRAAAAKCGRHARDRRTDSHAGDAGDLQPSRLAAGAHAVQVGIDGQHFPVGEEFVFGLTDPRLNDPARPEFNPNLSPFDLSRGGVPFRFRERGSGQLFTAFFRDRVNWRRFVVDLGLRYDRYQMLVRAVQWQPRIGLAYHIKSSGTVLRASYNRNFQTPPNENLLLASSPESAMLAPPDVRRTFNGGVIPIEPQRQNVYEAGLQQDLAGHASLDLAFYHKHSTDPQDNDNFLNTGIVFPTSLAFSRVNGFETRLVMPMARQVSGSFSLTHFRAIVTPPFTGGLFLGSAALDSLTEGPFVIDHDQALGMTGSLIYRPAKRWWSSWQVRYDSGLVSNPSDPAEVSADPDYFDQLPFVDLHGDPPRIRPRTIIDASLGYEHYRGDRRAWEIGFQISNLTNRKGLYSFQSVFVGTRVVQPFTASAKLRIFW